MSGLEPIAIIGCVAAVISAVHSAAEIVKSPPPEASCCCLKTHPFKVVRLRLSLVRCEEMIRRRYISGVRRTGGGAFDGDDTPQQELSCVLNDFETKVLSVLQRYSEETMSIETYTKRIVPAREEYSSISKKAASYLHTPSFLEKNLRHINITSSSRRPSTLPIKLNLARPRIHISKPEFVEKLHNMEVKEAVIRPLRRGKSWWRRFKDNIERIVERVKRSGWRFKKSLSSRRWKVKREQWRDMIRKVKPPRKFRTSRRSRAESYSPPVKVETTARIFETSPSTTPTPGPLRVARPQNQAPSPRAHSNITKTQGSNSTNTGGKKVRRQTPEADKVIWTGAAAGAAAGALVGGPLGALAGAVIGTIWASPKESIDLSR